MILLPLALLAMADQAAPPDYCPTQGAVDTSCIEKLMEQGLVGNSILLGLGKDAVPEVAPDRAPVTGTYAGAQRFEIATAGDYEVRLSEPAWIDIARDGRKQPSIAHHHGDPASPFRKIVTFHLEPGRYVVQITGSHARAVQLGISPAR